MTIMFINHEHRTFYNEKVQELNLYNDRERCALIYVLSLTQNCRKNLKDCFDGYYIKPDALKHGWVTSADARAIRFAFGLFSDNLPTVDTCSTKKKWGEARRYNAADLFCCHLAPFFCEAVKIRYPEFFDWMDEED